MPEEDKPLHAPAFETPRPVVRPARKKAAKRTAKPQTSPEVQPPADEAPPSSNDTKDVS